tara:strand:+ start:2616 stop:3776 length:1161 start_codon:yes stop_codon:yes gene_type:complete
MTSRQSKTNNINRPLTGDPSGNTFTGQWENSSGALVLGVFVASPTLSLVTIEQSVNRGVTTQLSDTFNIGATQLDKMNVFRVPSGFAWFRVIIENFEGNQTYLSLNTYLESFYNEPTTTVSIGGIVDVSGSVAVTNLITETLATRRVDFLVVGDYYRVASVGITSGAQWNEIGAIVDGESVPVIGRLFKCLAIGPAVAGGGECYDVEYTDAVSATITNFPSFPATQAVTGTVGLTDPTTIRVRDTYGDPIVTTAGNLMVGIGNIYTANPLHVIVDSVTPPTTAVTDALAVSNTGVTIKASAGKLLTLFINSDGSSGTNYVKIYNVAVPTSASTPIFTIAVNHATSQNVDCSSLNFSTAIGVRCTNAAAAGDNTPASNTVNVAAFFV